MPERFCEMARVAAEFAFDIKDLALPASAGTALAM
jgi:hypothetical protein